MAANYWTSTQYRFWMFSRHELADMRQPRSDEDKILSTMLPLPERRQLNMFFQQLLLKLQRRMNIRQQAIATAQVYIRRLYLRVEIRKTNPYLVTATALYLACKMEECPQHIRTVVGEARTLWPDFVSADVSKLGECEFFLIAEMNSQLIVHHPYRTLMSLRDELEMEPDEVSLAWSIINDHYVTDLPLLYPLHVIAITAIFLAIVLKPAGSNLQSAAASMSLSSQVQAALERSSVDDPNVETSSQGKVQRVMDWLAEGEVDIQHMIECTQEIISLYEALEQYSDKACKEQVSAVAKNRNYDS